MRCDTVVSHCAGPSSRVGESQRIAWLLRAQQRASVKVRAADALCKDLVNEPKRQRQSVEGSSTVTFLGAGGKEMSVECPKVNLTES